MQVSEIDIEKPIYDLGFKILNKQNELFNEQFAGDKISRLEKKVDKILSSLNIEVTSEEKEKNTLFGRKNKKSESEKVKVSETHRVQEPNVEEAFKKYDSVVKRINTSPSTDVFDVFDLIRTGVFNKEQTKVIEEAIKRHLTIVEILQFAKPENTADTMEQLLSYLISVREGSAVKKARDRQIPENITKNINKRKTDNNEEEQ